MIAARRPEVVVLARGDLAVEEAALAIRIALALPLGGVTVRLILADSASALALADPPQLGPWSGGVARELEALIGEEEVPVLVEMESLAALGLAERPLHAGVEVATRAEVVEACGSCVSLLVL
ncbi:MAG TPA: hypothetical protein VNF24_01380 [Candidatus Acidoferrales bacterium]|nr:hypothetical protein [Candidatus Acidoferrales bacterium]